MGVNVETPTSYLAVAAVGAAGLQVLSRILSMAYANGIVDSNPMSRVKRLRA